MQYEKCSDISDLVVLRRGTDSFGDVVTNEVTYLITKITLSTTWQPLRGELQLQQAQDQGSKRASLQQEGCIRTKGIIVFEVQRPATILERAKSYDQPANFPCHVAATYVQLSVIALLLILRIRCVSTKLQCAVATNSHDEEALCLRLQ
jgi:hypothetical protein